MAWVLNAFGLLLFITLLGYVVGGISRFISELMLLRLIAFNLTCVVLCFYLGYYCA